MLGRISGEIPCGWHCCPLQYQHGCDEHARRVPKNYSGARSSWHCVHALGIVCQRLTTARSYVLSVKTSVSCHGIALATGNVTVNMAPPPGPDVASTFPLCSRRIALEMLKPRPVPRPGRLVV